MKKSSTFLEAILSVCFLPGVRKFILPIFIFVFASATFYSKVKETASCNAMVKENINIQNELNIKNTLQARCGNIQEVANVINKLVDSKTQPELGIFSNLTAIDISLQQLSSQFGEAKDSVQYISCMDLIQRKLSLYRQTLSALQNSNNQEASQILNSPALKSITDSLHTANINLLAESAVLSAGIVENTGNRHKDVQFWKNLVYISGIIFCFLVYLYVYVKGRLSSESETKVKASAAVKENFLANMSHEIRTPLNAVLGFTNILQKTKLETEQREYVDIIQTSGDNLLSIVNDILDLSKIEAGMMRIEEAPFRVSDIISTVETMLKPKAEEKKLQFVVNLDSQVPEIVSGDAVRLTQILVNLVSNSIKFTEEGGVYLRVTMVKKENGVAKLEFLVRDTGIGIPSEKQPTIFDRFEQAEAETTRRFGGTGLGLSIVKNLVELQKGTISLFSQNGNGSSFTVELSFKICDVESTAKREIKKQANISDSSKSKIKVLIAEDNAMNQRLIKHLMQSRGYHFDLVFNGIQAIESLKKQTYDMVLMDIQMPEMDGYTATRQIRNELNLHIPIIAMTAHAMSGEKEKCIRAGMNDYLSKPIDEEILFDLIQQYSRPDLFEHKKDLSGNKGPKVIELRGGGNQNEDMTVFNQEAKRKSLVH